MSLMVNGKKVLGYALGNNAFYSVQKNKDGSINFNGTNYSNLGFTMGESATVNAGSKVYGFCDVSENPPSGEVDYSCPSNVGYCYPNEDVNVNVCGKFQSGDTNYYVFYYDGSNYRGSYLYFTQSRDGVSENWRRYGSFTDDLSVYWVDEDDITLN